MALETNSSRTMLTQDIETRLFINGKVSLADSI
jgi:hypothetical protein